jgi:uncharacterized protein YegL
MKQNFTSINVIIDRSGSMSKLAPDTIGSFNTFLAEQKVVPGEAAFTLCTFNDNYSLVHDFVTLSSVPELTSRTYYASGGTALLDALGTTIKSIGARLAAMAEDDRPSKVIFLIITDGQENSSHIFSKEQIRSMVEHQKDTYKWEFVFMGANIDAISEGTALGISMNNTLNYDATSVGTKGLYNTVSESMRTYRMSNSQQADFFAQPVTVQPLIVPATPEAPKK